MAVKTIRWEQFCGASYQLIAKYAAIEDSINFYPEVIEDPDETKAKVILMPTPCTGRYGVLPVGELSQPSRALLELNGRLFGINGDRLFEFLAPTLAAPDGTFLPIATDMANDNLPAYMIANGVTTPGNQQIFISSADAGYILTAAGVLTPLTEADNGFIAGRGAAFLDDYFISLIPNTNGFQVSGINDGRTWFDTAYTQGQSDVLVNLIADREYLWLFGSRRSEIWAPTGSSDFPFAIQPSGFLEIGLAAAGALTQADNAIFFLGQDKRGARSAWRTSTLIPTRISNHAVEQQWAKYARVDDCITYSFLWAGHTFVRFIFPSAGIGWTYDCSASQQLGYSVWHKNTLTLANGVTTLAPIERTHAYFQGVHVVGSGGAEGNPGSLYQFTNQTIIPANPVLRLRYSNDAGNTYGDWIDIPVGASGEYDIRVLADLLGESTDRVYWVRCVDFGDAGAGFPIIRDRVCPHIVNSMNRVYYDRLEFELSKAIGQEGGNTDTFWALVSAYLTFEIGQN